MKNKISTSSGNFDFTVKRKNMKSMRLRVNSDSVVEVSAPFHVSDSAIKRFVADNADFVQQRLLDVQYNRVSSYPVDYKNGDMFSLLGDRSVISIEQGARNRAKLYGNVLTLKVIDTRDKELCKKTFENWAKRYAKKIFEERLNALLPGFGRLADKDIRISVRDMKTRWGSINVSKDTMSLSVHLLRCDMELIDHIIMHELCHYAHTNHSRDFYSELGKHSPNYKNLQKKLKECGMVGF